MAPALDIHDEAWELSWVTRLVAALSNLQCDPATAKFIDNDTEVQFGKFPVVKGLEAAISLTGVVYNLAATLMKEVTRVHIHSPSNTIYVTYTVHITVQGDPDAKEVLIPTMLVVVKTLGRRQENIRRLEVYNDWTPFFERAKEMGRL